MELRISSQEAAASFDALLDRVSSGTDTVIIERDGKPLVRLIRATDQNEAPPAAEPTGTVKDLVEILKAWPRCDDGWAEGVEEAVRLGNQPMPPEDPWDR